MKYNKTSLLYIWLDSFSALDYKNKSLLFEILSGAERITIGLSKNKAQIISAIGEEKFNLILSSSNEEYLKGILLEYEAKGVEVVTLNCESYPKLLKDTEFPPLALYCAGDTALLSREKFSIVGSRKCLPLSVEVCKNYAKALCETDLTLVTGIAEGIDVTVINTCLSCGKPVISVIAGGIDNIYPASHKSVIEEVIKKGLVISEHPPRVKSMPYYFPLRNRIIAGLSIGALIVSAGLKSGTMHTAEYAEQYGRDLFALPYSVGVESGAGCNELIKNGALLTDTPDDILSFYGKEKSQKVVLSAEEKLITGALKGQPQHVEKICQILNKQIFEISPTIAILEIKGIIAKTGNNVYSLIQTNLED